MGVANGTFFYTAGGRTRTWPLKGQVIGEYVCPLLFTSFACCVFNVFKVWNHVWLIFDCRLISANMAIFALPSVVAIRWKTLFAARGQMCRHANNYSLGGTRGFIPVHWLNITEICLILIQLPHGVNTYHAMGRFSRRQTDEIFIIFIRK